MNRREPAQERALFYERRVRTFAGLQRELRRLDSDAGIRVEGRYLRRSCLVFVTRFVGRYTVMVYESKGSKRPTVGKRVLSRDYESPEELEVLLRNITRERVEAYLY